MHPYKRRLVAWVDVTLCARCDETHLLRSSTPRAAAPWFLSFSRSSSKASWSPQINDDSFPVDPLVPPGLQFPRRPEEGAVASTFNEPQPESWCRAAWSRDSHLLPTAGPLPENSTPVVVITVWRGEVPLCERQALHPRAAQLRRRRAARRLGGNTSSQNNLRRVRLDATGHAARETHGDKEKIRMCGRIMCANVDVWLTPR